MRIFFPLSQMPEVLGLEDPERRWVLRAASARLEKSRRWLPRLPVLLCVSFGVLSGLAAWEAVPFILSDLRPGDIYIQGGALMNGMAVLGSVLGGVIGLQILVPYLRPHVRTAKACLEEIKPITGCQQEKKFS